MKHIRKKLAWTPQQTQQAHKQAMMILGILFFLAGPFLTVAALNTLFNLTLTYSLGTWLAALWLQILMVGRFLDEDKQKSG